MTISPNKLVHFVSKDSDSNTIQDYRFSLYREWKQNGKAFNPIRRFAIRYYLQVAHKIFAVSAELKRALEVNGINNVEVLHNAVDLSQYTGDPNAAVVLKREIGLADTNKVILVAGRMSADKGGIEAVRIFKEVLVKTPDAVLVVLSGNEYTSHMMHEARQLGIDRNVRCIEAVPRPKMITYYELSDVVIMTSLCLETFGMVALEAMAMKKPVVVSSFGGTRELVTQGVNGYVVNPLRTKEFADKIVEVISDDARAHRMGLQSRNIAEKQFSLDRHVDKLLTWYISFDRE
jgi:glycosyltransferase involved in cell wall biosynthesis